MKQPLTDLHPRRRFLIRLGQGSLLISSWAALLSGCRQENWPESMAVIDWDHEHCARCGMIIRKRDFACEVRGGPDARAFKFDDIGCLMVWLHGNVAQYPWLTAPATHFWVAESGNTETRMQWLDPRQAHYIGKASPMRYNFAAVAGPQPHSVGFPEMRERVLAQGR